MNRQLQHTRKMAKCQAKDRIFWLTLGDFTSTIVLIIREKNMKRSEMLLMVLQVPVDFCMLLLAAVSAYYLRFTSWAIELRPVLFDLTLSEFMRSASFVALVWLIIFACAGLYSPDPNRKFSKNISRVIFACSTGLAGVALYVMFTQQLFDSRFLVAAGWVFAVLYVMGGRLLMRGFKALMYRMGVGLRRVVIIGSETIAKVILEALKNRPGLGYKVIGVYDSFTDSVKAKLTASAIDECIFTNPRANEKETLRALDFCNEHHIVFKYSADLFATYAANMTVHPLAGIPIVELKPTRLGAWGRVIKRMFDIAVSIAVIILLSPVFIISALVIIIETGLPIIYRNERIGLRGSAFMVYKFRTMFKKDCTGPQFGSDGEKAVKREEQLIKKQNSRIGPIYKVQNDPRVTGFGRFLRRFSIDELPQFFNVLVGNMSIIGPRPHQPREVEGYTKEHKTVFSIKPGITGLAQISGRSDLNYEEEMKLDILYIERWSLWLDIIILLKTPFVLFKKRKAE